MADLQNMPMSLQNKKISKQKPKEYDNQTGNSKVDDVHCQITRFIWFYNA